MRDAENDMGGGNFKPGSQFLYSAKFEEPEMCIWIGLRKHHVKLVRIFAIDD